jgi:hypothetical protein
MEQRTLLVLLQPCHLIVLIQAWALLKQPSRTINVALLMHLAWLPGCVAAVVVPDAGDGAIWLSIEMYYIEHAFCACITPIYLMLRHRAVIARCFCRDSLIAGMWSLLPFHWPVLALINVLTHVNIQFMLCPSQGMADIFAAAGIEAYLYPSYRSVTNIAWIVVASISTLALVGLGRFLALLFVPKVPSPAVKKQS